MLRFFYRKIVDEFPERIKSRDFRHARIDLIRMNINNARVTARIEAVQPVSYEPVREKPEKEAAGERDIASRNSECGRGALNNAGILKLRSVWEPRKTRYTEKRGKERIDA